MANLWHLSSSWHLILAAHIHTGWEIDREMVIMDLRGQTGWCRTQADTTLTSPIFNTTLSYPFSLYPFISPSSSTSRVPLSQTPSDPCLEPPAALQGTWPQCPSATQCSQLKVVAQHHPPRDLTLVPIRTFSYSQHCLTPHQHRGPDFRPISHFCQ